MSSSKCAGSARPASGRARLLPLVAAMIAVLALVAGCSDDDAAKGSGRSDRQSSGSSSTSSDGSGSSAGSSEQTAAEAEKAAAEELAAARAASKKPSGIAGEPAPNDDDGARNLAAPDPASGPSADDTSGSVAKDPMTSPTPTFPEPGRPDVDGLQPLDGCGEISAPFYRAVSSLNVSSTPSTILEGVKDLTTVAQRAQAPIAAAVQTLLTTAQTAAADAARAQDFASEAYQNAVKAVHVYLGDACGR